MSLHVKQMSTLNGYEKINEGSRVGVACAPESSVFGTNFTSEGNRICSQISSWALQGFKQMAVISGRDIKYNRVWESKTRQSNHNATAEWRERIPNSITSEFHETALLYRADSTETLAVIQNACFRGKKAKSDSAWYSAKKQFETIVVGIVQKPRCIKNLIIVISNSMIGKQRRSDDSSHYGRIYSSFDIQMGKYKAYTKLCCLRYLQLVFSTTFEVVHFVLVVCLEIRFLWFKASFQVQGI